MRWTRGRAGRRAVTAATAVVVALGIVLVPTTGAQAAALSCVRPGDGANTIPVTATATGPTTLTAADGTPAKAYAGTYTPQAVAHSGDTDYVAYYAAGTRALTVAASTPSGAWQFATPTGADGRVVTLDAGADSHNDIAMAVDPAGGLHLLADMHSSAMQSWTSAPSGDLATMTFSDHLVMPVARNAAGVRTDDEGYVTYPTFFTGPGGALFLMWRSGWSNAGKTYVYGWVGGRWQPASSANQGMVLNGWTGSQYGPYPARPVYNPSDRTWNLVWTWQDDGTAASTSTVNAMKSTDLKTWTTIGGTVVPGPVTYGNAATVVDPAGPGSGLRNSNIQPGLDPGGRLAIAYYEFVGGGTQLVVARPDGLRKNWMRSTVSAWTGTFDPGSTGDPNAVFVSRGPTVVGGSIVVDYTCAGQLRRATVGNGSATGSSKLLADAPVRSNGVPAAMTTSEFPTSAGYRITWRTAADPVPDVSGATTVLQWESGSLRSDGSVPPESAYPVAGSTLRLWSIRG